GRRDPSQDLTPRHWLLSFSELGTDAGEGSCGAVLRLEPPDERSEIRRRLLEVGTVGRRDGLAAVHDPNLSVELHALVGGRPRSGALEGLAGFRDRPIRAEIARVDERVGRQRLA